MKSHLVSKAVGAVILAAFYSFLFFYDWGKGDAAALVREQFHLPASVELASLLVNQKDPWVNPPSIQAIVSFPEKAFHEYLDHLDDPSVWKPQNIVYDGTTFTGTWARDALAWTKRDANRELAWGNLSADLVRETMGVRLLCFQMHRPKPEIQLPTPAAVPCSTVTSGPVVLIQGLIDPATRTLHVVIRGSR